MNRSNFCRWIPAVCSAAQKATQSATQQAAVVHPTAHLTASRLTTAGTGSGVAVWALVALLLGHGFVASRCAAADPPAAEQAPTATDAATADDRTAAADAVTANAAAVELDVVDDPAARAQAVELLQPLADAIAEAKQTRATIELTSRSMIHGQVIASEQAIYQIASQAPNRYNVQLKGGDQMLQIVCDGLQANVVLGGIGYFQVAAPATLQDVVPALPLPLGPYPEPLMALSLAGADLPASFIKDMAALSVDNRQPLGDVAAAQIRGVQADGVHWSLWVATAQQQPRPLRLKVDLTKVVVGDNAQGLPDGFAYELDAQFTQWRTGDELEDRVFQLSPPADLPQFASLDELIASLQMPAGADHPLVNQPAPEIEATLLDGKTFRLSELKGQVVMLDFWATWCGPCLDALPVITEVGQALADQGVVTYALNIGETPEEIQTFLAEHKIDLPVILDPEGETADRYHTEAVPQTVLIDKQGRVAAVHVGFAGLDELRQQLTEQLQALADDQPAAP